MYATILALGVKYLTLFIQGGGDVKYLTENVATFQPMDLSLGLSKDLRS